MEVAMASRSISTQDRQCIAGCIFTYYGGSVVSTDEDEREENYQQCLENCQVCG